VGRLSVSSILTGVGPLLAKVGDVVHHAISPSSYLSSRAPADSYVGNINKNGSRACLNGELLPPPPIGTIASFGGELT
jgi:hypothetical protein